MPRSLGVNEHSYSGKQFYADIQGYIRFKTPRVPLRQLVDPADGDSALSRIRQAVASGSSRGDGAPARRAAYQLKMFGCVARANVRDRALDIRAALLRLGNSSRQRPERAAEQEELTRDLLDDVALTLRAFRALTRDIETADLPRRVRETYAMVDEYLSLLLDVRLSALLHALESPPLATYDWQGLRGRFVATILSERRHRQQRGYVDTARLDDHGERLVSRLSMLKKFVHSVLWLEISKAKEGRHAANAAAAIAAGMAMFAAVVVTLYHSRWFALNSWGFVIAATITYVLKDRIKDWLKLYFRRAAGRWAYDYSVDISDPLQGSKVGHCREAFSYLQPHNVPAEVQAFRRATDAVSIEAEATPEVVLRYSKLVRLHAPAGDLDRAHLESYELNDIIRLSLRRFLSRADDPASVVPLFDERAGCVVERELHKVYGINLVLATRAVADSPVALRRLRIDFDKQSVLRIVELRSDGSVLDPRASQPSAPTTSS